MDSSNGIASRTRSQCSRRFAEQYGFNCESLGKNNEHEIERKNRKGKNLSRSIERKSMKKRKMKHHSRGFEVDDEVIEIITEAKFRNTRSISCDEGVEIESLTKDEFLNCKRDNFVKEVKIEITDEDEFQDDHSEGDEIARVSETESRNSLRRDHEEGVESESNDEEGIEFEMIDEKEFLSSRRRLNHVEEGSFKCRSEKDHKYEHEMNDLEDNEDDTKRESGGRTTTGCSDSYSVSEGNSEKNDSRSASFQENETRSRGLGHESDLCIARRTRSKRDIADRPLGVDNVVSDSLYGSSSCSDRSDDSWSSYSEPDDENDEDFVVKSSDDCDSMELSGSYVEEDDDDCRKTESSDVNEFSDSNDEEECSWISRDASSTDEAEVEVQNLQENNERTARNVDDRSNVREGNLIGSEREDLVRSSLDSNQMFTRRKCEEHKVGNEVQSSKKQVNSSTDTKSSGVAKTTGGEGKESTNDYEVTKSSGVAKTTRGEGKESVNRYGSDKILQREGKKMKSHETSHRLSCENKENDEDGNRVKFDMHDDVRRKERARDEEIMIDMFEKTERPRKRLCPRKDHDLCKNLLDAVLDESAEFGDEKNHEDMKKHENTLLLRFRFEDEDTKPIEKSELELMIGSLFDEMDLCLKYGDIDMSGYEEVEKDNANHPDDETNQYARCCKGKHYLIHDDELGLICSYCLHVELEAKHVIPPWAEKTYRGSNRRLSGDEQGSIFNGLNLEQDENLTDRCDLSKGTIWSIKPGVRETMYEHQREGFEFLWKNLAGTTYLNELETAESSNIGGCIISHAPGTGKTRLTMVFIETYLKLFPNCRPLIIAPASMLLTWEEEFRKWKVEFPFHNLNSVEMSGEENKIVVKNLQEGKSLNKDAARMIKIYSWNKERSILGISYHLFELLAGKKSKSKPLRTILLEKTGLVVLDEGHTPRSRRSNIWNTLLQLKTKKRIILSGTPFQNNFEELLNILRIVRPSIAEVLAKERIFAEMMTSKAIHLRKKFKYHDEECQEMTTNRAIEELKAAMAPFVHVHKGTILQQSLPGLRDCVVLLKPTPLQKALIERIEGSQCTFKFDHKVALISMHPYLFKYCLPTENERKGIDFDSLEACKLNPVEGVKTRYIMELVRLSAVRNEKVLIFSQYIKPLALIQCHLKKIFRWTKGKHILKMEGKMGQKKRQDLINAFNDPKSEAKVLLASTRCCSEGINLVGASRVILLDVVWNPSVELQAISRAYRLGQKKIVYTYHLMMSGTTEGDKYCKQAEKERLSELVFTSSSNEKCRAKNLDSAIEDEILEEMVENGSLKDMFEQIIYQPKEKNLMDTFSIAC